MNATELKVALREASVPTDASTKIIVCMTLRGLRDYLQNAVIDQRGIVGFIVKIGLRRAVQLLDDYLTANCG